MDHLVGLKENVIIGKHIPAGTGMKKYRNVALNTDAHMEETIELSMEDEDDTAADAETAEVTAETKTTGDRPRH